MSFCVPLGPEAPLDKIGGKIGGKSRSLVKLAAAGLCVPRAIAVTSDLFAALRAGAPPLPATLAAPGALAAIAGAARSLTETGWPSGFAETLSRALAALDDRPGARFVVRSSAGIEDDAGALGAGLFLSRLDLTAAEVPDALRAVLASALAPGVVAYLALRNTSIDAVGFAALIHPFVIGDAAGTAALDSSHGAPIIETSSGDATLAFEAVTTALPKLSAVHGPVEVEWVATHTRTVTFLQLRPYRRAPPNKGAAPGEPGWRWDAVHNPLPLSPAQAGLVALVDESCATELRQKVIGGYLFYARSVHPGIAATVSPGSSDAPSDSASDAPPGSASDAPSDSASDAPLDASPGAALAALRAVFDSRLATEGSWSLDEALAIFTTIYEQLFGAVQLGARNWRAVLEHFLRGHSIDPAKHLPDLLASVPSAASARAELARAFRQAAGPTARDAARAAYLAAFGDEAPSWDVAAPTWREAPETLERRLRARGSRAEEPDAPADGWRAVAAAIRADLPERARAGWDRTLAGARDAAAVAEDDDALYARAQAAVRRALLRAGERLAAVGVLASAEEVFWLPLELVRRAARGETTLSRQEAARLVDDARRADRAACAAPPSLASAPRWAVERGMVSGRSGAGGVAIGRVRLWPAGQDREQDREQDRAHDREPEVIVARTILPTELPLISAVALVVETGGPLDHVAAQARERGIPAVVGAAGALCAFEDGDRVLVDGDAGLVARID
jgi:phosphohistidine swiveling domain-containing protein